MKNLPENVTALLAAISSGDHQAENRLFSMVYGELHALAHAAMRREPPDHILQTTALIHETYLRLVPGGHVEWRDREHFFRVAAKAMRRILISEARKRKAAKRGHGRAPIALDAVEEGDRACAASKLTCRDLEALNEALEKMAAHEGFRRMCTVVELFFFAGFTQEEIAGIIGVSKGTVRRDWEFAKVWLQREIRGKKSHDG